MNKYLTQKLNSDNYCVYDVIMITDLFSPDNDALKWIDYAKEKMTKVFFAKIQVRLQVKSVEFEEGKFFT